MIKLSYFKHLVFSVVLGSLFLNTQAQNTYFERVWVDKNDENQGQDFVGWSMPPTGLYLGNGYTSIQSNRFNSANGNVNGIYFFLGGIKIISFTKEGNVEIGVVNPNAEL